MQKANEKTLGLVNEIVDGSPGVKEQLAKNGVNRVADNLDMRILGRTLSAIDTASFNDYYSTLINKIGTQIITASYDNSGFKNILDQFKIMSPPTGDTIEIFDTELAQPNGIKYGDDTTNEFNNPFLASKVRNFVKHIKIQPTIHYALEKQIDVISEAFTSTQNLDAFVSKLIDTLQKSADSFIWNNARDELLTGFTKEITTGKVLDLATAEGVKLAYQKITELCLNMVQESKEYNEGVKMKGTGALVPKLNATPLNKQIVLLNSKMFANFNVNVIASLFNSSKLLGEKFTWQIIPFKDKDGVDILTNTIAIISDKGRFILSTKMNEMSAIYNPMGPSQVHHLNRKMFWGHIPYFNGVKLINKV